MKKFILLSVIFLAILTVSCSSDNDDEMDTHEVTYTNTISGIINGNCIGCHGATPANGAPMSLNTYTAVKDAAQTRNLVGAVESGWMPPNGALTAAQIANIKTWQANNYPQ